jgi:hypothetical protein
MRPDDIFNFTRRQPFAPFRLHTTEGRSYDIKHPDQIIVLRSRVDVGVGGDGEVSDKVEHIALIHVVRLEELAPAHPGSQGNGHS